MKPPAKLSDLIASLEYESEEYSSFFDRETGQIVTVDQTILSAVEEGDEEALKKFPFNLKPFWEYPDKSWP